MSTRAPKSKAFRRPATEAEIDAAIEEVRRETAAKYAGSFDRKAYIREHSRRARRKAQVPESGT